MARIPDDELERLKREMSLERLVASRGVELEAHGADLIGLCPFHDDREPSLVVTPAKNLWHCLGACQTGGSPIDWVMKAEGVSFRHAVELLRADHFPDARPSLDGPRSASTVPKLRAARRPRRRRPRAARARSIGYYHADAEGEPRGPRPISRTGASSIAELDRALPARLRQPHARLPPPRHEHGRPAQEIRDAAAEAGRPARQRPRALQRLARRPDLRRGGRGPRASTAARSRRTCARRHAAAPLPPRPAPRRLQRRGPRLSKEVILCEALIDALTFWCAGFRNVTAAYGVEGFTARPPRRPSRRYGTERVLIAYDRDEAGDKRRGEPREEAQAEGIGCFAGPVSEGDGRQRVRAQGPAGGEEPWASSCRTAVMDGERRETARARSSAAAAALSRGGCAAAARARGAWTASGLPAVAATYAEPRLPRCAAAPTPSSRPL